MYFLCTTVCRSCDFKFLIFSLSFLLVLEACCNIFFNNIAEPGLYLYEGEADFSNVKMFTGSNKAVDANDDKILSQSRSNKDWRGTPFFKLCTVRYTLNIVVVFVAHFPF